ncbi:MAG: hypothetical protein ABI910_15705 [Gemmatimonadota bacterium]
MNRLVYYLPIVTTVVATLFTAELIRRYRGKGGGTHLLWWAIGTATYGAGTLLESSITLFGWHEGLFRLWYIFGALLGGAPLAQGSAYLHLGRRTANRLTVVLLAVVLFGAVAVLLTPIDYSLVEASRPAGRVIVWHWVRLISPVINIYAFVLLAGSAAWSAWHFTRIPGQRHRAIGNVLISVGAILPGIGGSFTRMGYVEVLYVTELLGLLLIYAGYRLATRDRRAAPATSPLTSPASAHVSLAR